MLADKPLDLLYSHKIVLGFVHSFLRLRYLEEEEKFVLSRNSLRLGKTTWLWVDWWRRKRRKQFTGGAPKPCMPRPVLTLLSPELRIGLRLTYSPLMGI